MTLERAAPDDAPEFMENRVVPVGHADGRRIENVLARKIFQLVFRRILKQPDDVALDVHVDPGG